MTWFVRQGRKIEGKIIISNLLSVCLLLLHCINIKITGQQWMFIKQ